jgi:hypothetical protein
MAEILSLPGMQSAAQKREPVGEVVQLLESALMSARKGDLRSIAIVGVTPRPSVFTDRAAITAGEGYALVGALHVMALELSAQLSANTENRDPEKPRRRE